MKTIFKSIVGSQAYGLNTATSDTDYKGVFQCSNKDILGLKYKSQIEYSKDHSEYEVRRFLELLQSANPSVLELLYTPEDCILVKEPQFECILKHRDKFLTKKCRESFGGYAVQQIRKARGLNKKFNWEESKIVKRYPIDFCYIIIGDKTVKFSDWLKTCRLSDYHIGLVNLDHAPHCYSVFFDLDCIFQGVFAENSDRIITSSIPKDYKSKGTLVYNRDSYQIHCKEWESYQTWLKERNEARYVETQEHGQQIDSKHIMHTRRLLNMAMEIPAEGILNIRRKDREKLLEIRRGEVILEDVLKKAEDDLLALDDLYKNSNLSDSVDDDFLHNLLLEVRLRL